MPSRKAKSPRSVFLFFPSPTSRLAYAILHVCCLSHFQRIYSSDCVLTLNFVFPGCPNFSLKCLSVFFSSSGSQAKHGETTAKKTKTSGKRTKKGNAQQMNKVNQQNYRERLGCDVKIGQLQHAQGEAYSADENRQALLTYYLAKRTNASGGEKVLRSKRALCEDVAATLGRGYRGLLNVVNLYENENCIKCKDDSKRGMLFGLMFSGVVRASFQCLAHDRTRSCCVHM